MSNQRIIRTKLTPLWTTLQIRLLEPANPGQSLYRKNKHGYYAGTHPIYAMNGVLGIELIDRRNFQCFCTSSVWGPCCMYIHTTFSLALLTYSPVASDS